MKLKVSKKKLTVFFNRFLLFYCLYSDKADWFHVNALAKQQHFECFDIIALRSNISINNIKDCSKNKLNEN